jgi:uncharacterized protein (TIGR03067 family)
MRLSVFVGVAMAVILTSQAGMLCADPDKDTEAQRIVGLIQQLGDDELEKREAASKELEAIGEPALAALRKAASSEDAEVRRRAESVIEALRVRAEKEMEKLHGHWDLVSVEIDGKKQEWKSKLEVGYGKLSMPFRREGRRISFPFTIDPAKTPKELDLEEPDEVKVQFDPDIQSEVDLLSTAPGLVWRAIYKIEGGDAHGLSAARESRAAEGLQGWRRSGSLHI